MGRRKKADILAEEAASAEKAAEGTVVSTPLEFVPSGDSNYDRLKKKFIAEECYHIASSGCKASIDRSFGGIHHRPVPTCNLMEWLNGRRERADLAAMTINVRDTQHTLQPYEGTAVLGGFQLFDIYVNAAGPVWATSLSTQKSSSGPSGSVQVLDRYLAVGTSRVGLSASYNSSTDKVYMIGNVDKGDNLLQIWHIHGFYSTPIKATAQSRIKLTNKKRPDDYVPKPRGRPRKYPRPEEEEQKTSKKRKAVQESSDAEDEDDGGDDQGDGGDGAGDLDEATLEAVLAEVGEQPTEPALSAQMSVGLAYCVALPDRGPTWSAVWCPHLPSGEAGSSSGDDDGGGDDGFAGVLAVVNGDGTCCILQLPSAAALTNLGGSSSGSGVGGGSGQPDIGRIPVFAEATLRLCTIEVPDLVITCVAWSSRCASEFACGMSDGSVSVWKVPTAAQPGAVNNAPPSSSGSSGAASSGGGPEQQQIGAVPLLHLVDTLQLESQVPSLAATRCVAFCPYDGNLLLVSGQDDVKIWNLKDYVAAAFIKSVSAPAVASCWDPCGFGYYVGDCETTGLIWNPLWGGSFPNISRRELYTHSLKYGGIWGICAVRNDDQTCVLSAASDGTVRGGYTTVMTAMKGKNTAALELCRIAGVQITKRVGDVGVGGSSSGMSGGGGPSREVMITLHDAVRKLDVAIGEEKFSESELCAWQALDAVALPTPPPISTAPTTIGGKPPRKNAKLPPPVLPAELMLVAYGGAAGLVRVHSFDPLREMFSGPPPPAEPPGTGELEEGGGGAH